MQQQLCNALALKLTLNELFCRQSTVIINLELRMSCLDKLINMLLRKPWAASKLHYIKFVSIKLCMYVHAHVFAQKEWRWLHIFSPKLIRMQLNSFSFHDLFCMEIFQYRDCIYKVCSIYSLWQSRCQHVDTLVMNECAYLFSNYKLLRYVCICT